VRAARRGSAHALSDRHDRALSTLFALTAAVVAAGCGKSGPPLPPLVKLPAPPPDLVAERRGNGVDLQFTIPTTNTDGSRPANLDRVEVYAITAAGPATDDDIVRHGTRVASLDVKAPRDPDRTVDPEESDADVEPPEGSGLDQGAIARVAEKLDASARAAMDLPPDGRKKRDSVRVDHPGQPLLAAAATPSRTYLVVGYSTRGRKGPPSKRALVPLVPAPPAPGQPSIVYSETTVTVTWPPVILSGMVQPADTADVLPSTPIGVPLPSVAYHVYDVSNGSGGAGGASAGGGAAEPSGSSPGVATANKLTQAPIAETRFEDTRIAWGERRCYTVRAVEVMNNLAIEGDAAEAQCKTLTDTFAPAAPKGLQAVANEGSISLIWDPNTEKDVAGYLVFRGVVGGEAPQQITPMPIEQAMFNDGVARSVRYIYIVKAVDKAGNISAASSAVEGMARQ
jgi:hypothetical protein